MNLRAFPGCQSENDILMLSKTSGTTGTPKLVALSYRTISRRTAENIAYFPRPDMKVSGLFPSSAPALLSRYIAALVHGAEIVASRDPGVWERRKVDFVFGSTAQLRAIMADRVLSQKLPRVHLSGATGDKLMIRHLLNSFEMVTNGYGSTEGFNCLSVIHTLDPDGTVVKTTKLRGGALELVDAEDNPVETGQIGRVRLRNDYLADGYLDTPTANADAFRQGWFYPGDLARWLDDGNFEVVGRINDQFNLGGVKLNAASMDFVLLSVPGIADAICFVMPERDRPDSLRCFLKLYPGYATDEVLSNARIALMRLGGVAAVPERFLFAETLPRNANGKADRRACAEIVESRRRTRQELKM
ncbi:class I adenylate-forming enzyme family protein [Yoonia sp. R78084]|uniref:class I adenylate-forming enzyme family protein n=1 Tax=Yoonia sp. R78084 TaxID=3093869 RepID=UPI0037DCA48F